MPIITPKPVPERSVRRRAFTLVELMVASALGVAVLAAILTTFLFLGRSGVAMQNYADMETQARNAMETFAQDVRMAFNVSWTSSTSVTLTTEESGAETRYTYSYSSTAGTFTRQKTYPATGTADVLITGIKANSFEFTAYKIDTTEINLATTSLVSAASMTKQIQISLETARKNTTLATATNKVVSARFVLRNKKVTA